MNDPLSGSDESTVLFNFGGKAFRWSDAFLKTFKELYGSPCVDYLPLNQRVDNHECLQCIRAVGGLVAAAHPESILSIAIVPKDAAMYGLVIDVHDGVESVYIDVNKYVVQKMLQQYSHSSMTPNACAHYLLSKAQQHAKQVRVIH